MRIFITGGGGYIGTTLVPYLLENGHQVIVLDRFYFGEDFLKSQVRQQENFQLIRDDTRCFDGKA